MKRSDPTRNHLQWLIRSACTNVCSRLLRDVSDGPVASVESPVGLEQAEESCMTSD